MVNDPVGDMIARIKNAATRGRSKVMTPASKMRARVLDVLAEEGFVGIGVKVAATPTKWLALLLCCQLAKRQDNPAILSR